MGSVGFNDAIMQNLSTDSCDPEFMQILATVSEFPDRSDMPQTPTSALEEWDAWVALHQLVSPPDKQITLKRRIKAKFVVAKTEVSIYKGH